MKGTRIISADAHLDLLWLPADLWQSRLPERLRASAPKVMVDRTGRAEWAWEGALRGPSATGSDNAQHFKEWFGHSGLPCREGSLPPSDPEQVLAHMDAAGIDAQIVFGHVRKLAFQDPGLRLACNRAYNDFIHDLNRNGCRRILAMSELPVWSVEHALDEAKRVIARGAPGVEFSTYDAASPLYSPEWERLWALLAESRTPVGFHIGAAAGDPGPPTGHGRMPAFFASYPLSTGQDIAELIFSGVPDRHPELRLIFAECRIGWLAFLLEQMDRQVDDRPTEVPLSARPSELWSRQMAATFETDRIGARLLRHDWSRLQFGVMWGSDYPHNDEAWPRTDELFQDLFEGVPEPVVTDAICGRAARFFGI